MTLAAPSLPYRVDVALDPGSALYSCGCLFTGRPRWHGQPLIFQAACPPGDALDVRPASRRGRPEDCLGEMFGP